MSTPSALRSLHVFATLTETERLAIAASIASALGDDYRSSPRTRGRAGLGAVVHVPTGIELVIVPGGTFVAGMRPEEVEQMRALEYVESDAFDIVEGLAEDAPPRVVTVDPFLCARAPLLRDAAWKLLGSRKGWVVGDEDSADSPIRFAKDVAAGLLAKTPFRLLEPDEWEWVAREGGQLAFVNGATPEQAAAACNALYDQAYDPDRDDMGSNAFGVWGLPWGCFVTNGGSLEDRGGAAMGYPWQSDEIIMALCAFGDSGNDESCVRFAMNVPDRI